MSLTNYKQALKKFVDSGMSLEEHPYLEYRLWVQRSKEYEVFKEKWNIPIPNARYFVCIPDIFNVLKEGEIFIRYTDKQTIVTLKNEHAIVYRNPGLHVADIQKVVCRDVSHLVPEYIKDVIMCSVNQHRSLLSMLSNGDYDGDQVFVWWGDEVKNFVGQEPLEISKSSSDTTTFSMVKEEDVLKSLKKKCKDFFNYSQLPLLATKWKEVAEKEGADSPLCTKIALLHATAVDAFGTGVTVDEEQYTSVTRTSKKKKEEKEEEEDEKTETVVEQPAILMEFEKHFKNIESYIETQSREIGKKFNKDNSLISRFISYKEWYSAAKKQKMTLSLPKEVWNEMCKHVASQLTEYNKKTAQIFKNTKKTKASAEVASEEFRLLVEGFIQENDQFLVDNNLAILEKKHWLGIMAVIAYAKMIFLKEKSIENIKLEGTHPMVQGLSYAYIVFEDSLCNAKSNV